MMFFLPLLIAGCITFICLQFFSKNAKKMNILDLPNDRKQHEGEVPLVGGIAIFCSFFITCLLIGHFPPFLMLCFFLITLLGFFDDRHELSARFRLLGQMLIVFIAIFPGNIALYHLGDLFNNGMVHLTTVWACIFTILAWLSFMNASNMQDGVDGLAGTINFVQFLSLLFIAYWHQDLVALLYLIIISANLLIFLCFNFPLPRHKRQHKLFLGDAGSLSLGFLVAWFAIHFSQWTSPFSPVIYLWITAIPLFDFFAVTIGRLLQKKSPLKADRSHLHHLLKDKHWSPFMINVFLGSLSLLFSIIGLLFGLYHVPDSIAFALLLLILCAYIMICLYMKKARK